MVEKVATRKVMKALMSFLVLEKGADQKDQKTQNKESEGRNAI